MIGAMEYIDPVPSDGPRQPLVEPHVRTVLRPAGREPHRPRVKVTLRGEHSPVRIAREEVALIVEDVLVVLVDRREPLNEVTNVVADAAGLLLFRAVDVDADPHGATVTAVRR